jgi:hypothetical protein
MTRATHKLVMAATMIRAMPEPSTPEGRKLRREVQILIEQAAVQQAESSASCMRQSSTTKAGGSERGPQASVHTPHRVPTVNEGNQRVLVKDRIRDARGALDDSDARNILNKKKPDATLAHGYNTWCGG